CDFHFVGVIRARSETGDFMVSEGMDNLQIVVTKSTPEEPEEPVEVTFGVEFYLDSLSDENYLDGKNITMTAGVHNRSELQTICDQMFVGMGYTISETGDFMVSEGMDNL